MTESILQKIEELGLEIIGIVDSIDTVNSTHVMSVKLSNGLLMTVTLVEDKMSAMLKHKLVEHRYRHLLPIECLWPVDTMEFKGYRVTHDGPVNVIKSRKRWSEPLYDKKFIRAWLPIEEMASMLKKYERV